MKLTRVHPAPVESLELDDPATRHRLLELYGASSPSSLRLNLVATISGSAAGSDGTSETLTSRIDRRILGVIRELSDVVLVGAASVRAEGYQVPKRSRLAVVTSSGDLRGHRIEGTDHEAVLVIAPAEAHARVRETIPDAQVLVVPSANQTLSMDAVVEALRSVGLASIVCEGGPVLAGQLLSAGLVDEVCLTTSPQLGGPSLPLLPGITTTPATLTQLLVDEAGFLFARWALRVRPTTG